MGESHEKFWELTFTLLLLMETQIASETPSKSSVFSMMQHMASIPFSCSVGFRCEILLEISKSMVGV
jgi:hypothetical protein